MKLNTMKNNINNDDGFPPLRKALRADKSPTARQSNTNKSSAWMLMSKKSKSPSSSCKGNMPDVKSYKTALSIDMNRLRSKCSKIPLPKGDDIIATKKHGHTIKIKEELIDKNFAPIFQMKKGVFSSNEKYMQHSTDDPPPLNIAHMPKRSSLNHYKNRGKACVNRRSSLSKQKLSRQNCG